MSATSETEIVNLALSRLGHKTITSLTEGTTEADMASVQYPHCRDSLLRSHPWNFAIKRAALAQDATAPNHEFSARYALPTDCLKVIRTSWEATGIASTAVYGFPGLVGGYESPIPYRIEGRYLLCNESTVSVEYIARITDTAQFDEMFTDCLAQRLAAEMAMRLTDNASLTDNAWSLYQSKLAEARVIDAQEGTPRDVVDVSGFIFART